MKRLYIHSNGSAKNHGCEAIIRTTVNFLDIFPKIGYSTYDLSEEVEYGIDQIVNCVTCYRNPSPKYRTFGYFYKRLLYKLFPKKESEFIIGDTIKKAVKYDIALSVGGDNYCYRKSYEYLAYLNKELKSNGLRSILWGASIEPSLLEIVSVQEDLKRYDAIFIRESLSLDAINKAGIKENVYFYPDPAFTLSRQGYKLPELFEDGNTVGINLSPLILGMENGDNITYKNYQKLIEYILSTTNYKIALIPHVVVEGNDDRVILQQLYSQFISINRIMMIEDANCMQIKDCIARCRFFIGARTHATIAAYSTCVPTLVVGYSAKAKGIAKDLFGTYENYVIPVQSLSNIDDLTRAFIWLQDNETEIKKSLTKIIPDFIQRSKEAGEQLCKLINSYE